MKGWFITATGRLVAVSATAVGFAGTESVTVVEKLPVEAEAALDRAYLQEDGSVVVYAPLTTTAEPNPVQAQAIMTTVAALPVGSPDTQITFQVRGGAVYTEPVTNLQASHAFAFASPGIYLIAVSGAHHGTAWVEVVAQ